MLKDFRGGPALPGVPARVHPGWQGSPDLSILPCNNDSGSRIGDGEQQVFGPIGVFPKAIRLVEGTSFQGGNQMNSRDADGVGGDNRMPKCLDQKQATNSFASALTVMGEVLNAHKRI